MRDFDHYQTKLPYPNRNDYTTVFVYNRGDVLFEGSLEDYYKWHSEAKELETEIGTVEKYVDEEAYKAARKAYYDDQNELIAEFVRDLFEEFEVHHNPKAQKAYGMAYERGHSGGLEEVYNEFADLVDLIK